MPVTAELFQVLKEDPSKSHGLVLVCWISQLIYFRSSCCGFSLHSLHGHNELAGGVILRTSPHFVLCRYSWCEASKLVNSFRGEYGIIFFTKAQHLSLSSWLSKWIQCSRILWPKDSLFTCLVLESDFKRGIIKMDNPRGFLLLFGFFQLKISKRETSAG